MTIEQVIELFSQAGALAVLTVGVVGFMREWWVPGAAHRRLRQEKEQWKQLALTGVNTAERAVGLAEASGDS